MDRKRVSPQCSIRFGIALKVMLEEKGMSQGDIYRATGMDRSAVSLFVSERFKNPHVSTIMKIAAALDMTPGQFIDRAWAITLEAEKAHE